MPRLFENEWRAVTHQVASLIWMLVPHGEYHKIGGRWDLVADGILRKRGTDLFLFLDPTASPVVPTGRLSGDSLPRRRCGRAAGRPLFLVARLRRGPDDTIDEATVVYTVLPVETTSFRLQVELDYDSSVTADTIRAAFAFAQGRGADVILITDTAKTSYRGYALPTAMLWHVIDCAYWYERVLPVVVEPIRPTARPFEELRAVFRRVTWGEFKRRWYRPEYTEFWPVAAAKPRRSLGEAAADISDGPVTEVFRRLRETEPGWLIHNGHMIYSAVKRSTAEPTQFCGVEPCDYVCVWRRPGSAAGAAFRVWNPAYGQFVQDMGSWSDAE